MTAGLHNTVTIVNRRGLHARAAAKFMKLAALYQCDIIVTRNDTAVPGRSLMGLLTLGASEGKEILITCVNTASSTDAEQALADLSDLVNRGFDENDHDGS